MMAVEKITSNAMRTVLSFVLVKILMLALAVVVLIIVCLPSYQGIIDNNNNEINDTIITDTNDTIVEDKYDTSSKTLTKPIRIIQEGAIIKVPTKCPDKMIMVGNRCRTIFGR